MITHSEMARARRQIQRRIRVVLAQRRVDPPDLAAGPRPPAGPEQRSREPAPED
jgi:hypothetical protein